MQEKIERLVQHLSELQLQQTATIEELQALGGYSSTGVHNSTSNDSDNEETNTNCERNTIGHNSKRNTKSHNNERDTKSHTRVHNTIVHNSERNTEVHDSKSTTKANNKERDTIAYCYDRDDKRIAIHDRVHLLTKGKFKVRVGKVTKINNQTKWITIELDTTGQITKRKSNNVRVEPSR